MKKFWKIAAVTPTDDGYTITLDGRLLRTPARNPLLVTNADLAAVIAAEWDSQSDEINPASMPMTGLANASIDLAGPKPAEFAAPIAEYAVSDLLCYREARDPILLAEQAAAWNPILNWAEQHFGVEFAITKGVLPIDQPPATIAALQAAVMALAPAQLVSLAPLTTISGSLVSALAVIHQAFDVTTLWNAVALDDIYQEKRWGEDAEATKMLQQRHKDWHNAARFLDFTRS